MFPLLSWLPSFVEATPPAAGVAGAAASLRGTPGPSGAPLDSGSQRESILAAHSAAVHHASISTARRVPANEEKQQFAISGPDLDHRGNGVPRPALRSACGGKPRAEQRNASGGRRDGILVACSASVCPSAATAPVTRARPAANLLGTRRGLPCVARRDRGFRPVPRRKVSPTLSWEKRGGDPVATQRSHAALFKKLASRSRLPEEGWSLPDGYSRVVGYLSSQSKLTARSVIECGSCRLRLAQSGGGALPVGLDRKWSALRSCPWGPACRDALARTAAERLQLPQVQARSRNMTKGACIQSL
ncbi:hypothetical protein MTO96_011306 [Rhipicephalus appendiculatus]